MVESVVDVYLHTNRPFREPTVHGFVAHAGAGGWSRNLSRLATRWDCCLRSPMNLPPCFKYDWLLEQSASDRRQRPETWLGLLSDNDVLFQCTASELRERFARFNASLVVGGERRWFPLPRDAREQDPESVPLVRASHSKSSLLTTRSH